MNKQKLKELQAILEKYKVISMNQIKKKNKFITSETYECELNDGHKVVREKLKKAGKDGSAVMILNSDQGTLTM